MTYSIYEEFIPVLEERMNRMQKKFAKYGMDMKFEKVGEEYVNVRDNLGNLQTRKKIIVDAEGFAKVNGWEFIASVTHTENGNLINKVSEIEIPKRYRTTPPLCEHCNTNRMRKETYLIRHENGEFKQVGKSCLKDYTDGYSPSMVALHYSLKSIFEEYETKEPTYGVRHKSYAKLEDALSFAISEIKANGYVKVTQDEKSTAQKVREKLEKDEIPNEESLREARKMIAWITSLENETLNDFLHNLFVICQSEYVEYWRELNILCALPCAYSRDYEEKKRKEEEKENSQYVGEVGQKIKIEVESVKLLTSWKNPYSYYGELIGLYQFKDKNGNIFVWKTQKRIDTEKDGQLVGTVKEHKEYNEVKQTILTRCKW